MTTAEDRAEAINALVIVLEDVRGRLTQLDAAGVGAAYWMEMRLPQINLLLDELKQAKLDRAKLALLIN